MNTVFTETSSASYTLTNRIYMIMSYALHTTKKVRYILDITNLIDIFLSKNKRSVISRLWLLRLQSLCILKGGDITLLLFKMHKNWHKKRCNSCGCNLSLCIVTARIFLANLFYSSSPFITSILRVKNS